MKHFSSLSIYSASALLLRTTRGEGGSAHHPLWQFGPQTRALTLDVVTREAQEAFPQFTVREAYISPIVRKRLAKEGVYKDSPTDALLKLRAEGTGPSTSRAPP